MIWFQTAKRLVISVRHSGALIIAWFYGHRVITEVDASNGTLSRLNVAPRPHPNPQRAIPIAPQTS